MPKRRMKRHAVTQPSDPSYRIIPLTTGLNTFVDTDDFERIDRWNWMGFKAAHAKTFYAKRGKGNRSIYLHQEVMRDSSRQWDHINRNGLDNRKQNLRPCTGSQNLANRSKQSNNTTGFKGVYWDKRRGKWCAQLAVRKKHVYIGQFDSPQKAAVAYDNAALIHHGEFAHLNFPIERPPANPLE